MELKIRERTVLAPGAIGRLIAYERPAMCGNWKTRSSGL
jgi:hypothetical protein